MRISKLLTTPLMSAVLAALASAGVDVLGKPQLGTFATIQEAIDAASEGDVLIVEDGIYPGFTITNKSLCVIGATGALVEVQGTCTIRNLGVRRRASLVGVSATAFQNANGVARPGLELLDNLGCGALAELHVHRRETAVPTRLVHATLGVGCRRHALGQGALHSLHAVRSQRGDVVGRSAARGRSGLELARQRRCALRVRGARRRRFRGELSQRRRGRPRMSRQRLGRVGLGEFDRRRARRRR